MVTAIQLPTVGLPVDLQCVCPANLETEITTGLLTHYGVVVGEEEFTRLYDEGAPRLLRYAAAHVAIDDVHDVVSATFEVVWFKRHHAPADHSRQLGWVFGICRHKILHHWRASQRREKYFLNGLTPPFHESVFTDDIADTVVDRVVARDILDGLSDNQYDLLATVIALGHDRVAAAQALDISVGTLNTRISRLRRNLDTRFIAAQELPPMAKREAEQDQQFP